MSKKSPEGKYNFYDVSDIDTKDTNKKGVTFYLKTSKEGKLFTGTINNAFLKTTLGSIPSKNEKIIIKNILPEKIKFNNPGPGAYDPKGTNIEKVKEHKIKGYGHGFLSSSSRFEEDKYYKSYFSPGPGEYDLIKTKQPKKKTLPEILSLKVPENNPGPGDYFPEISSYSPKQNYYGLKTFGTAVFMSTTTRNKGNENISTTPSPAEYFNNFYINTKYNSKYGISPFFRNPMEKRVNTEDMMHLNEGDHKEYKYILTNRKGELKTNWNTLSSGEKKTLSNKRKKKKDLNILLSLGNIKKDNLKIWRKESPTKYEYFSRASPRWVDKHFSNEARFKVVGPAYYFP